MTGVEEINGRVQRERNNQILQAAATILSHDPNNLDIMWCIGIAEGMLGFIETSHGGGIAKIKQD